jgi:hypothetical protein
MEVVVKKFLSLLFAAVSCLVGQEISFDSPRSYLVQSYAFAMGDFNKDGKQDVVSGSYNLYILTGNGDGGFQAPVQIYGGQQGTVIASIVVGDFNGDSKPDIAAVLQTTPGSVVVLLGNGNGTFQAPNTYQVGTQPQVLVTGDFTGDGIADLVAGNYDGTVMLLKGNGNGTFQAAISTSAGPVRNMVAGISIKTGSWIWRWASIRRQPIIRRVTSISCSGMEPGISTRPRELHVTRSLA